LEDPRNFLSNKDLEAEHFESSIGI